MGARHVTESVGVKRVLIVGAGIGGITAALAYAARGVSTEIVEIRSELTALGVGLGLASNGLQVLRRLGLLDECLNSGFAFDRLVTYDFDGKPVAEHVHTMGDAGIPPFCALVRRRLHQTLASALTDEMTVLTLGDTVKGLDEVDSGVVVTFESGRTDTYDLVVGFDGIRSQVRSLLFGDAYEPQFTGFGAWRVVSERPDRLAAHEKHLGEAGRVAGIMPISSDLMYVSRVVAEPGNPFYEGDLQEQMRRHLDGFGPTISSVQERLDSHSHIVYSPLETVTIDRPWHEGRVVLAGDAAHAGVPHLTLGASMALEDAYILADETASNRPLPEALHNYMDRRRERCQFVQDAALRIMQAEQQASTESVVHNRAGVGTLLAEADQLCAANALGDER